MDQREILWQDFEVGEISRQSLLVETAKQIGMRIEQLTDLSHPRLLRDVAVERKNGRYFLGRETIPGLVSLGESLKDKLPEPEELCGWLITALEVLTYVHEAGINLEGVTLDNVYLSPEGELYLADYAPYRMLSAFRPLAHADEYRAPESFKDTARSAASDVWSLGVVAYRAACGVFPFTDKEAKLIGENILEREPLDPRYYNPKLSAGLAELILSLLTKDPAKRPTASSALNQARKLKEDGALRATSQEEEAFAKGADRKISQTQRSWQRKRFFRNNWGWFAGGIAVILILVSLFRSGKTEEIVTAKTTPLEVVKIYYQALDDLDVIALEQTIDPKVGKQTIDLVSRLHVIEKVNMGMRMQSVQNIEQKEPSPDLVQVDDLQIQGGKANGEARYTATYKLTMPGEGGKKTTSRRDSLLLRKVEGKWRIVELESVEL
jgi:serine/threonine protein kinase